ncbi:MAG: GNAT family N-acetyltransferase [Aridibacter famidurans]|nr:GNAT family N-acetyltransferase [Aridibacter famidurans]
MPAPASDRIRFRPYIEADQERFTALMTDTAVMKHVGDGPLTKKGAHDLWNKLLLEFYPNGLTTIWGLEAKEDGRYLGHGSIRPRPEHPDEWEIGYILEREEWGKGFATEAARALVLFGFEELGLNTVFATVDEDNDASIRVLAKAGLAFRRYDHDEQGRYSVYAIDRTVQSVAPG